MKAPAHSESRIPRAALVGAGLILGAAIVLAGVSRLVGYNATPLPASRVVASYDLNFHDRADGGIGIFMAKDGRLVEILPPGSNGFVRGVLRGLARERRANRISDEPPFQLTRWADGRLSLLDPSTNRQINLEVFGATNAGAFAQILIASSHAEGAT